MSILDHTPYGYLRNRGNNVYDLFIVISIATGKEVTSNVFMRDGTGTSVVQITLGDSTTAPAQFLPVLVQDVKGNTTDTGVTITCISERRRSLTLEFEDADTTNLNLATSVSIAKNVPYLSLTKISKIAPNWEPRCLIYKDGFNFSAVNNGPPNPPPGIHTAEIGSTPPIGASAWTEIVLVSYPDSTSPDSDPKPYFEATIPSSPRSKGKIKHKNHGLQPGKPRYTFISFLLQIVPPVLSNIIKFFINLFYKPVHKMRL